MTVAQGRLGRRQVLRSALAAAGAAATWGWVVGCGPQSAQNSQGGPSAKAAAPQSGPAPVEIVLAPWGGWPAYAGSHWPEYVQPAFETFHAANPGIRVKVVTPGGGGSFLTQILAGTAPDVFQDWSIGPYRAANAVLDLSAYLRRDNLDLSLWSPGQIHAMRDNEGIQFLPCYVHVTVMAVNYGILDNLGLAYPDPNWTYEQATQLYRSCTFDQSGKHHYGVGMYFNGTSIGDSSGMSTYVAHFFGGSVADPSRIRSNLGDPKSYQGIDWAEQLYYAKVMSPNERDTDLANIAFIEAGSNAVPNYLKAWTNKLKWSFIPVPQFPAGQFSFEATDYYAINSSTKHPEESWTLLKWLTAEPYWSRYCMRYLLRTPSLVNLWGEYVTTIEAVAPFVKGKGLQHFTEAAAHWGIANTVFKYNQPQVANVINTQLTLVSTRKASTQEAMQTAAQQVDALQSAGAQEDLLAKAKAKAFPTSGPDVAPVPAGI